MSDSRHDLSYLAPGYDPPAEDTAGRYRIAGTIITSYDGGNHPIYGDVLACRACGALVLPADTSAHDTWHAKTGTEPPR